jgi:hypothetical protein
MGKHLLAPLPKFRIPRVRPSTHQTSFLLGGECCEGLETPLATLREQH